MGSHFDHFDLDSESGQSTDKPELDDDSPDEFVEQNNVNKIIQSLIDNKLPIHHCTQVQKLHPVEEDLMIVMKKHNLPIHLYKDLLALVERATASGYDFLSSPIYETTLDCMKKKYYLEAGPPPPPVRGTVTVDGPFPPMHVYQFILLHHVKQHYNNHSRNICRMVRDCDIHQADGDDPDYPCTMVEQQPIDNIVTAAMLVVES